MRRDHRARYTRGRKGTHQLPVTECRTCSALIERATSLPDLCPYCGADPLNRPRRPRPANAPDLVLWLAGYGNTG